MESTSLSLILYALAGGILPALVWLWFWLKEDTGKPEPKLLLLKTFLLGAIMIAPAFFVERLVAAYLPPIDALGGETFSFSAGWLGFIVANIPLLLIWALWEEIVKLGAMCLGTLRSKAFDEPLDYMIYMITAALGFAAAENTLFLLGQVLDTGELSSFFLLTGNLRFLGATILHVVSSAIIGAFLASGACHRRAGRIFAGTVGVLVAGALHAGFNFFIIIQGGAHFFRVLVALWFAAVIIILLFERVKKVTCPLNLFALQKGRANIP